MRSTHKYMPVIVNSLTSGSKYTVFLLLQDLGHESHEPNPSNEVLDK